MVPNCFLIFIFINLSHVYNWSVSFSAWFLIALVNACFSWGSHRAASIDIPWRCSSLSWHWTFEHPLNYLTWSWPTWIPEVWYRSLLLQFTLSVFNINIVNFYVLSTWWGIVIAIIIFISVVSWSYLWFNAILLVIVIWPGDSMSTLLNSLHSYLRRSISFLLYYASIDLIEHLLVINNRFVFITLITLYIVDLITRRYNWRLSIIIISNYLAKTSIWL